MNSNRPSQTPNPFAATKAVDLEDEAIDRLWIDLPGGFAAVAQPTEAMPRFIMGGKGSGKTHLLRYLSYNLQRLRHPALGSPSKEEGYLGIYVRCGGLNSGRFAGKGVPEEAWDAAFAFFWDVWLAQLAFITLSEEVKGHNQPANWRGKALSVLNECTTGVKPAATLEEFQARLRSWQRAIEHAVNQAALSRRLDLEIFASPGKLVFGVPRAFAEAIPSLRTVRATYLVDELENITARQQVYFNTLVREREDPATFKVSGRLYSHRTRSTLSAGEELRVDSEFDQVVLDEILREHRQYPRFARRLIAQRLRVMGTEHSDWTDSTRLDRVFDRPREARFRVVETDFATEAPPRKHHNRLEAQLKQHHGTRLGVRARADIVRCMVLPDYPLLEKFAIYLLYSHWSSPGTLLEHARSIRSRVERMIDSPRRSTPKEWTSFGHVSGDLFAQLRRDYGLKQEYLGIDTMVAMSYGLPRNLLTTFKMVYQWAVFNGEAPFSRPPISRESQRRGVLEAGRWFLHDAQTLGTHRREVSALVERLGELFREIRFSDRPAECSLSSFSVDGTAISAELREVLNEALQWSLLIRVSSGRRNRNSGRVDEGYQLNPMICPLWDLPVARRGVIELSASELASMSAPDDHAAFQAIKRARLARMNVPFKRDRAVDRDQTTLLANE